jgi:transcriptional regulator with XRE-family HTH domain
LARNSKSFSEAAGFTQEELATIAGLSVHAVSALERVENDGDPMSRRCARCPRHLI